MKRIRVLEVLATLKRAGAENMAVSLARGLDRERFEVEFVSLYDAFPGGLEPVLAESGIAVQHLGKRPGWDPRMYPRLRSSFCKFHPDVVHTHSYVLRYTLPFRAPARVHTVHNLAEREVDFIGRAIHRLAWRVGVTPVAVAGEVARSFSRVYGRAPAATIPNGIETERFFLPQARERWREAHGFTPDEVLFVSAARLDPQKNPVGLAEAFAPVRGGRLVLAGDGSLRAAVEGRERVQVLGVREDVPELLAAADVFVLASDWEGHPVAVMEAMAAGLPVVATRVGGVPELVEHGVTGLLVERGDMRGLGEAMASLARDAARRSEMGETGRRRAAVCFSVRTMVEAYQKLFERLCASRC